MKNLNKTKAAVLGTSAIILVGGLGYGVVEHYNNDNDKQIFVDPVPVDGSKNIKPDPFPTTKDNNKGNDNNKNDSKKKKSETGKKDSSTKDKNKVNKPVNASNFPEPEAAVPVDNTVAETPIGLKDGETKAKDLPAFSVSIPSIKTVTKINPAYGDVVNKKLTVPSDVSFVKYKYGADYNDINGTILLASHINYGSTPGALNRSNQLKPGDKAYVVDGKGHTRAWKLQKIDMVKKDKLPKNIFTKKGENKMVMVTCGGTLLKRADGRHFDSNVILTFVPSNS